MMEAAVTNSPQLLETQIDMIVHVRSAWQQLDVGPSEVPEEPAEQISMPSASMPEPKLERIPFSQSG